jgi:glycosyltransferase involved in cell wall biosynthesis
LPDLSGHRFELALDIHPSETNDLALLATHGWRLVDPRAVAGDPWAYQAYIQNSRAEFMVAKNMYVQAKSGWFSDRSICYLASGKPVLAQDTGIGEIYPTGEGLLTYTTLDEALAGVEEISRDYGRHARAARAMAEEHFDSDKVLSRLLGKLGVA